MDLLNVYVAMSLFFFAKITKTENNLNSVTVIMSLTSFGMFYLLMFPIGNRLLGKSCCEYFGWESLANPRISLFDEFASFS